MPRADAFSCTSMARRSRSTQEATWTLEALHLFRHRRKERRTRATLRSSPTKSAVRGLRPRGDPRDPAAQARERVGQRALCAKSFMRLLLASGTLRVDPAVSYTPLSVL